MAAVLRDEVFGAVGFPFPYPHPSALDYKKPHQWLTCSSTLSRLLRGCSESSCEAVQKAPVWPALEWQVGGGDSWEADGRDRHGLTSVFGETGSP